MPACRRTVLSTLGLAVVVAWAAPSVVACHAQPRVAGGGAAPLAPGEIRRTLVDSRPATGLPGWETRLYLIEYGPDAVAPLHAHPVVGIGRVLDGAFESAFGDDAPARVEAGQGFVDPAGVPHRLFRNAGDTPLRFVIAYTIPVDQPIVYPGKPPDVALEATGDPIAIDDPGLYPETIAYDPRGQRFLVGSMSDGGVYAIGPDGAASRVVDDPRLTSVLGVAVDAERDRIWAVTADLGVGARASAAGPKALAAVGVYDRESGTPVRYIDLASLVAGPHLLNGLALDARGDAYVTDSFASAIYKITADGDASVLVTGERFAGEGVNLNGIVVHPHGYLLVVKKSDGALFRVTLANPAAFSEVKLDRALVGGDGLVLTGDGELVVIANKTPAAAANAAIVLSSEDEWASASVRATLPLGDVYATTAVQRDGALFAISTKLDELLRSTPEQRATLRRRAEIRRIGTVGPR
jgi:quercetin dioxygenase-like cupin family protein/sugar lactone lactonase YvrE